MENKLEGVCCCTNCGGEEEKFRLVGKYHVFPFCEPTTVYECGYCGILLTPTIVDSKTHKPLKVDVLSFVTFRNMLHTEKELVEAGKVSEKDFKKLIEASHIKEMLQDLKLNKSVLNK